MLTKMSLRDFFAVGINASKDAGERLKRQFMSTLQSDPKASWTK
jgi:hypothetical protein